MKSIDHWRQKIDQLDLKLLKLLNERSKCAIEIGKIKNELGIEIYDPNREEQVIHNVQTAGSGPLSKDAIRRLFERIIDESRRAEREYRSNKE
ncbi:MAG: chorismate mutase [Acidobacteriota bacterium]